MSDFFDLLFARSLGVAPLEVRPRPVARFEQPDLAPVVAAMAYPESVAPARQPGDVAPGPQPPEAPVPLRHLQTPPEDRALLTIREERVSPGPPGAAPPPVEPPAPVLVVSPPLTRADPSVDTHHSGFTPAPPPVELRARSVQPEAAAAPPEDRVPVLVPVVPLAPAPAAPPEPPAATVVQVRIGRVELHAPISLPVQPPAPRSAPVPTRPVRSLEEYLRSRDKERR